MSIRSFSSTLGALAALFSLSLGAVGCGRAEVAPASTETQQASIDGVGDFCGGFAGVQCPTGLTCVDDPTDTCDPATGGRDCAGICVVDLQSLKCSDPRRTYVSHDPNECAVIRYTCDPGSTAFSDECGCGCEKP